MFCSTFSSMYQYHAAYDLSSRFLKVVHRVRKKGDTGLLLLLFILLISFTGQTQQKMSGKTIIKYRITTLWNLCAQKSPCLAELSEVNSHARLNHSKQSLKNIHPLTLASFSSPTKDIYSGHTGRPTEYLTVHIYSNQEERRHNKTPVHKSSVQSLMASVGRLRVVDITPVWYFTESRSVKSINCNVMLLQQLSVSACYTSDLTRVLHLSTGQCPSTRVT